MIKRIVSFALHQPLFIILGVILFVGGGILAFKNLPVEALPDVTDTQVQVIPLFRGRAAEELHLLDRSRCIRFHTRMAEEFGKAGDLLIP